MRNLIICLVIAALMLVPVGYLLAGIAAERLDQAAARIVVNEVIGACKDVAVTLWR
jgi:hypothetical protein